MNTQISMNNERIKDIEDELEMKSGENNRLRKSVADLEAAMHDLYKSRKGQGSLSIELENLKQDNERLLNLLKDTCEYSDKTEDEIVKIAKSKNKRATSAMT